MSNSPTTLEVTNSRIEFMEVVVVAPWIDTAGEV
jgi:hypothetical protein